MEDSDEEDAKVERASQFKFSVGDQFAGLRGTTSNKDKPAVKKGVKKMKKNSEFSVGKSPRSQSADATK